MDAATETGKRIARTEAYAEKVRRLFASTVNEILAMNKTIPTLEDGVMFSFDGQSVKKQKEVDELLRRLHSLATLSIEKDMELEWEKANDECDKLLSSIFGKGVLETPQFAAWLDRNTNAMRAFIERSDTGLNLSDRVWRSVRQLRDEMEIAMTVAIGEGDSASSISRKVRQYLNDPDLMFRRFRYKAGEEVIFDDEGNEIGRKPIYGKKWKKRIKDEATGKYRWIDYDRDSYKTGSGVYKSSAKNAMRVARTETNMAYRRADNERWKRMDFVLGQRIQLSNSHPVRDICDTLAGDYPKEFIFEGWHPQCFCFVTPILMDEDEMARMSDAFIEGKDYKPKGKPVKDYPEKFKDWVKDNSEKITDAHDNMRDPYFVRHNWAIVNNILHPKMSVQERARIRHEARTDEQVKAILGEWYERKAVRKYGKNVLSIMDGISDVDVSALRIALKGGDINLILSEAKKLKEVGKEIISFDNLVNPLQVAKDFSMAEAKNVQDAISNTINTWLKKYSYADWDKAPNLHKKAKLEQEINSLIQTKKYSTWEVAQKAYLKKLAPVQDAIDFESFTNILAEHKKFLKESKTTSPIYKKGIKSLEASIIAKDKAASQIAINELNIKKAELEKKYAAKKAKSKKSDIIAPISSNNTEQKGHVQLCSTLQEAIDKIKELTGITDDQTAKEFYDAVNGFSFKWDYEIRQVQCGNSITSRHGHTFEEIKKRAQDLEIFISKSPQWNGGTTYRGMSLSPKELDYLRNELNAGDGNMLGSASWSTTEGVSRGFAAYHIGEKSPVFDDIKTNKVLLVTNHHKKATSIKYLSEFASEDEVLASMACRYKFVSEERKGDYIYITVEPK